jgi:cytochrome c-type biogenesis protein CcmF
VLGAYWAYETLGWGGYWGWDPVENSSLVPWLLLTALLHSMLVQRLHGSLRRTNIVLTVVTFLTVIYATFLTRSGVLSNFSVHSFVAEGLNEALIAFMAGIFLVGAAAIVLRWRDIPRTPLSTHFLSRENFSVLAVLSLVVLAVVITLGTSMPVISAIPGIGHSLQDAMGAMFEIDDGTALGGQPLEDGRFSLAPSFYERVTPPLGIVIVLLLILSPLLDWRDAKKERVLKGLQWPFVAAIAGTIIAMLLGVREVLSLVYIALATWAAGTNILMLVRTIRTGWSRVGGYLSHAGLCILLIGIVGSTVYASPDERVILAAGESASIHGFDLTFNEWKPFHDGKGILDLTVAHGNETFSAQPQLYFDQRMNSTMQTPAIKTYPTYDLYIAPVEYKGENDPNQPVLVEGQVRTIGPYEVGFEGFQVDEEMFEETGVAEIGAKLAVTYEGETTQVVPSINLTPKDSDGESGYEEIAADMPGDNEVLLKMFDPSRRMVLIEVQGLNLPVDPAQAVFTVSIKPAMMLVWAGMLIGLLGGFIAMYRRSLEGKAQLERRPVHLPGGEVAAP